MYDVNNLYRGSDLDRMNSECKEFKNQKTISDVVFVRFLEARGDRLHKEEEEQRDDVDLEVVVPLQRRHRLSALQPELGVERVGGVLPALERLNLN